MRVNSVLLVPKHQSTQHIDQDVYVSLPSNRQHVSYDDCLMSTLEVCSQQRAIQVHVYLTLPVPVWVRGR